MPSRRKDNLMQFGGDLAIKISRQIIAERKAWRSALGVPQGFQIPEKPLPATEAERLAEIAKVTEELDRVTMACIASPPGPECESLAHHMLWLRSRLIALKYR
jgi:hypothetical protein